MKASKPQESAYPFFSTCVLIAILFIIFISPVRGMQSYYPENSCQLIAKDFQKEYGGSLVWIQPLTNSGAYDLGEYNAHVFNRFYIEGKLQFYDFGANIYFETKQEVNEWYKEMTGKYSQIFVLSEERPAFGMIWHY